MPRILVVGRTGQLGTYAAVLGQELAVLILSGVL